MHAELKPLRLRDRFRRNRLAGVLVKQLEDEAFALAPDSGQVPSSLPEDKADACRRRAGSPRKH
jgi:Rod binding domain-containing protein